MITVVGGAVLAVVVGNADLLDVLGLGEAGVSFSQPVTARTAPSAANETTTMLAIFRMDPNALLSLKGGSGPASSSPVPLDLSAANLN